MRYLKTIGLSWTEIASLFGVSRMYLYLKRKEDGIFDDFKYSDEDLEQRVRDIKREMPDIGERIISGVLHAKGVCVQRHRLRSAIHSVDPVNMLCVGIIKFIDVSIVFLGHCHCGI